ncbi:MAG: glycosyltransferase, partial [Cyanobium sp.]
AAVPKFLRIELQPASGSTVPPLNGGCVEQELRVTNSQQGAKALALRLKLVGPHDGRYTPRLQSLAQELGIGHRCDWLPWVSDGERLTLLNRCRALVMGSFWEGFGLPALEAMACETPVIAARAGALPEVVGDAALLVNPSSPPEIAAAMDLLERDTGLARTLGTAGAERASRFRWDQTAADVLTVLRELA